MRKRRRGVVGAWAVGALAAACALWAVADFVVAARADAPDERILAERPAGERGDVVELHRLLPDASDHVGRAVRVDGTVVGAGTAGGFFVRDLRDNVVFVGSAARPGAGTPVRVEGVLEPLPPAEETERLQEAGAAAVAGRDARLLRDVQVVARRGSAVAVMAG
ncbi:MAG TPA: hypothetical protein VFQ38_10100 [Longimicrobiales bacterium]|nr:hypothetical protein [Longimicrobiales bacterium]